MRVHEHRGTSPNAVLKQKSIFETTSNDKTISGLYLLSCLVVAFLFCSNAVALGTDANFEPDPAAVKAAEEAQAVKTKDKGKKQEVPPKSDTVEKVKTPSEKLEPSDTQKPKEAINGEGPPSSSGESQAPEKPADEYIRGY